MGLQSSVQVRFYLLWVPVIKQMFLMIFFQHYFFMLCFLCSLAKFLLVLVKISLG